MPRPLPITPNGPAIEGALACQYIEVQDAPALKEAVRRIGRCLVPEACEVKLKLLHATKSSSKELSLGLVPSLSRVPCCRNL